jgi:hypothetical protein
MKIHFQYWGALYILAALFMGSLIGQFVYQVVLGHEDGIQFLEPRDKTGVGLTGGFGSR